MQRLEVRKNRAAQWPDLEDALFEWQQLMMRKEATITGEILKEIAAIFWSKLPQYADEEQPKFSTGWLDGFKNRHQIRKYRRHGEVGAVDNVVVETELKNIREHLKEYDNRDIFNMDETGLFWKMSPDGTLATQQTPGGKHEKARISVNFATNVTGTDKLPPWFIGKAANPRCFGRSGINIHNFRMVWRFNQKAWMTGRIFKEYLLWFDNRMTGRKVILLIDGFSAHKAGDSAITRFDEFIHSLS